MKKFLKFLAGFAIITAIILLAAKQKNMTTRQSVLKAFYPALMAIGKLFGAGDKLKENPAGIKPAVSFYSLNSTGSNGQSFSFEALRGKKVLLVNTASDCGYTGQYEELEELYRQHKDKLVIIAFPANDFKEQEAGNDEQIAQFCTTNYGITFPLMKKSVVIKSAQQNPVFQWLTDKARNGWNDKAPSWNFSKYLVDENGILLNYFEPAVSPLSKEVTAAITRNGH